MVNALTVASMMVRFIQRRGGINSLTWIGMGGNIKNVDAFLPKKILLHPDSTKDEVTVNVLSALTVTTMMMRQERGQGGGRLNPWSGLVWVTF